MILISNCTENQLDTPVSTTFEKFRENPEATRFAVFAYNLILPILLEVALDCGFWPTFFYN